MDKEAKNKAISKTLKETRKKRANQVCKVFEVKIDKSHLNKTTLEDLNRVFLEAKWYYNFVLSQDDVFKVSDKLKEVEIKVKDEFEKREIRVLSAQIKQSLVSRLHQNIISLSKSKKKGNKIGKLKHISYYNSIELRQFGKTHKIKGNRIKVEGIKQWMRVRGLSQLEGCDIANAKLIQKSGDYYLHITCFKEKQKRIKYNADVGIDFGIKHQLTLSNSKEGVNVDYIIEFPKRLRKLCRQLSKMKLHSSNWYKQQIKVRKEYEKWTNKKKDTRQKILHILKHNFDNVCSQTESIKGWQRIWGRRILSTSIGGITAQLKKSATSIIIDRFYPSTKTCSCCGSKKDMSLKDRIYDCGDCGYKVDRDFNSANNMLKEGLKKIGVEYTESTPVEIEPLRLVMEKLNAIPRLCASLVVETGSPRYL